MKVAHDPYQIVATIIMLNSIFTSGNLFSNRKTRVEVARVSAIYYYPVKSCHAIQLEEAECSYSGLHKGDIQDR